MPEAVLKDTKISLVFDNGVDANGKQLYKTKTFNNVALRTTPEGIQQFAQAIASLQQKGLLRVERNDSSDVLN
ncbi:DUF1659 domain-containing protein [Heyndrickxia ginsengihumi]|uniref:DUF1659 domain-containing protein n=1 Tax=Heyndrickxia ginsengihumi TaxID=363870 RepID=A0A0A6VAJ9_9BACI|nr:DUF1659 domain-containing protein [Heyndrickxia ginsengihumi]KHD84616.1 hypothetical protein NG54_14230 [Heyndrickxia ginsengihumi]MBE6183373.1 DUF1659 domain-containing protein [Bacillus sp. (in: firmicutes)]MCM3025088.1 DUF1659 domain-containing protein [Heyndrickxia ginsengihumi]NEY19124.1 DUF1659 domain-containing protein [Heyndrickxia ginsengihumi]